MVDISLKNKKIKNKKLKKLPSLFFGPAWIGWRHEAMMSEKPLLIRGTSLGLSATQGKRPASTPGVPQRSPLFSPRGEVLFTTRPAPQRFLFSLLFVVLWKDRSPLERPGSNLDDSSAQLAKKAPWHWAGQMAGFVFLATLIVVCSARLKRHRTPSSLLALRTWLRTCKQRPPYKSLQILNH